ncbi:molybdopterin-dependent oxidoreductase [Solwaraspora sp. WMMD791]|uniref:molybdopterin-dependent oxidoreductase n=1 Tax=Solwaraspora sp. WMMD791 TaxID=3016086 RepID=UPI00249B096D|nr:molybdopterin-dependent oxidoreductase [Solwaraspora sp. WMMD791]WFE25607.1 molybdopterin-dependent oxidoreductase [Solwaraspora sp. WMMD791]
MPVDEPAPAPPPPPPAAGAAGSTEATGATVLVRWRSPLRGAWLTSVLGAVLLVGLPLVIVTGLLDHVAYGPQAMPADVGWLRLPPFDWPTRPSWLFRVSQGLHVALGIALVPVILVKLWSVIPKLFAWPPVRSAAHALERISLLLLVGGILFQTVTGVLNVQYAYLFGFDFYTAHYFGAWVFTAAFVVHVALKLPRMIAVLRSRPDRAEPDELVAPRSGPATISRRGLLALTGGGSLLLAVTTVGQSLDGPWRRLAFLLPRGQQPDDGPNGFPVNRTAAAAGIRHADTGPDWRLELRDAAGRTVRLDRDQLLAMPLHTARLPIACVEGWSTLQTWTGVRLRDLAALAGVPEPTSALVRSIQRGGLFNKAILQRNQVLDGDSLLALRVNGVDLSPDHGFPARIIVPALPGVRCTKWVRAIEFQGPRR